MYIMGIVKHNKERDTTMKYKIPQELLDNNEAYTVINTKLIDLAYCRNRAAITEALLQTNRYKDKPEKAKTLAIHIADILFIEER